MKKQSEPLIQATRKARREFDKTPLGKMKALCALRSKWKRRETIARNKLDEIEWEIDDLALWLAGHNYQDSH